jgi:hypothetical protein
MGAAHFLDLARIDVRAAADGQVLHAVGDEKMAFRVEIADVASMEPAFFAQR